MTPPRLSPSKELLEAPIWTTWARYFSRVNQAKVLKYAHEIVSRNLQVCHCPPSHRAIFLRTCHWACKLPQCDRISTVSGPDSSLSDVNETDAALLCAPGAQQGLSEAAAVSSLYAVCRAALPRRSRFPLHTSQHTPVWLCRGL